MMYLLAAVIMVIETVGLVLIIYTNNRRTRMLGVALVALAAFLAFGLLK